MSNLVFTVHHSATAPSATFQSIHDYHAGLGWGGFGYTWGVTETGEVWIAGDIGRSRSCVRNENHRALCAVVIDDLTGHGPSQACINSLGWLYQLARQETGIQAGIFGHRDWPDQGTACPGASWPAWKHEIIEAARHAVILPEDQRVLGV